MRADLSEILACPACRGSLKLHVAGGAGGLRIEETGAEEVMEGSLECSACNIFYPIRGGLPDLIRTDLHPDKTEIEHSTAGVCRANRDYHDRHAATYETDKHTNFMFFGDCQRRIEEVVKWAAGRAASNNIAIDIGCGTGNVLKYQAKYFGRAFGIDLAAQMMSLIPESGGEPLLAAVTATPFPDESLDFVSSFSLLHHLFEPLDGIKEAYRVLRPGGVFYSDWDFNRFFRTKALFSLWLHNLNPFSAFKGLVDHFLLKDDENELFTMAEYHAFRDWLDAQMLADSAKQMGFSKVYTVYHWNHASIIDKNGEPFQPVPKGVIPVVTVSRDPLVAFPIFSLIAIK